MNVTRLTSLRFRPLRSLSKPIVALALKSGIRSFLSTMTDHRPKGPGPNQISVAAYDFRSDTVTTPTSRMLEAMATSTHGDDVYFEDESTLAFQSHIAKLLGHEKGLFVSSGTAGNQISLRTHLLQPPHSVLCDHRAHIATYEAGGLASLSQAMLQPVVPQNGTYLTLEDVKRVAIIYEDIHVAPTRVISLENTLGGTIMPLEEVKRISAFARENNIKIHLDGARLWNACAAGAGSLEDYGKEFDSVTVCFSKGLGAPIGSVLVGKAPFVNKAAWIRKSIGGAMRQTGVLTNAAWAALDEVYPKLPDTHAIAKDIESHILHLGLKTLIPVQTNMIWIDITSAGLQNQWFGDEASKRGIRWGHDGRVVIHHQICSEAVKILKETIEFVVEKHKSGGYGQSLASETHGYGTLKQ